MCLLMIAFCPSFDNGAGQSDAFVLGIVNEGTSAVLWQLRCCCILHYAMVSLLGYFVCVVYHQFYVENMSEIFFLCMELKILFSMAGTRDTR